ncbi:hypothetical protein AGMMS49965_23830 [Bacteroidia bacterium]|nr:hypothetical protein AGMMS49965_23830 [Bacteroidia bacterium]
MTKVEVEWLTPLQQISGTIFDGLNTALNNTTLDVPVGTKTLYEKAPIWRNFTVIEQEESSFVMAFTAGTATTAVTTADGGETAAYTVMVTGGTAINDIDKDKILIYNIPGGIAIETTEATPISIFNVTGQKVHQSVVIGSAEIHLNKGVYIVKANNGSRKVIVM